MRESVFLSVVLGVAIALVGEPASSRQAVYAQQPSAPAAAALGPSNIAELPEGFAEQIVASGITGATAMAVAADGRVFVCEQTGALRIVKDDALLAQPFVTLKVDSAWERGLIGVALDPGFPKEPYVYLCYVAPEPFTHHRISRFTDDGDVVAPGSEVVLLAGDDQAKIGGRKPDGHQGGAIHFGADGKLYIAIGDQTTGSPAQGLDNFQGKLLRINRDGSIPDDNPFYNSARDKYRAIWAYGLRNPFAFGVRPGDGRILINDVGEARWEEIDQGVAGANYGWPHAEGPSNDPRFKSPLYAYDRSQGRSIAGGAFYSPATVQFPQSYVGKFFFTEFMDNWIRVIDPDHPTDVQPFASGLAGPVDVQVGPDGSLYVLDRNAWVKDENFKPNTGSLHRIFYVAGSGRPAPVIAAQPADVTAGAGQQAMFRLEAAGQAPLRFQWRRNNHAIDGADGPSLSVNVTPADDGAQFRCLISNAHGAMMSRTAALWTSPLPGLIESLRVGQNPRELPRLLSETGVFVSLTDLTPTAGVRPYEVNSPLWSDGAEKRRWLILPPGTRIGFSERGAWKFPPGSVFVKHFEFPTRAGASARRLETRLLVVDRRGAGYGVTYKWRADGSDAELITEGLTEEIDLGDRKQIWTYPTRNDCVICHTANAGFVLGVNTRQLNRAASGIAGEIAGDGAKRDDNLLASWNRVGLFEPAIRDEDIARLDRLVAIADASAPLEHRVRSYLDSNCAQCHRPGGARGEFDARFDPRAPKPLVNAPITSSDLGIDGAKLVVAGDSNRSMLYLRMKRRQDAFNMPPLASHRADPAAVATVAAWVQSLSTDASAAQTRAPATEPDLSAVKNAEPAPASSAIQVSDLTLHGDMDCFKIETKNATYLFGKRGAGFASIVDKDGHDWISYRPGDKSKGEYRGLPKCGQPTKFFHCGLGYGMYQTANVFTSRVTLRAADHVRIESQTADGKTACAWDFFPAHATLTLLRIDLPTYWFLYEGAPGGKLDAGQDFVIRPDGTKTTLDQAWSQVVPWVCFGAAETPIGFVCVNHQQPEPGQTDSYVSWPFQKESDGSFQEMTVFGFGRKGHKELIEHIPDLKRLPARFSIGFVETADHATAKAACEAITQAGAADAAK